MEFLEVAVETRQGSGEARRTWKVHGPDANGSYGGLQGIGGLEAVVEEATGAWTAVIVDCYGHVVAQVEVGETQVVRWSLPRCTAYGPQPGSPVFTLSLGASVVQATSWRGKRLDVTGFYFLGARYYDPVSGRFLSADPMGHGASMSLYDYAGGDAVNFVDPTGRIQKQHGETVAAYKSYIDNGFRFCETPSIQIYGSIEPANGHIPGRLAEEPTLGLKDWRHVAEDRTGPAILPDPETLALLAMLEEEDRRNDPHLGGRGGNTLGRRVGRANAFGGVCNALTHELEARHKYCCASRRTWNAGRKCNSESRNHRVEAFLSRKRRVLGSDRKAISDAWSNYRPFRRQWIFSILFSDRNLRSCKSFTTGHSTTIIALV